MRFGRKTFLSALGAATALTSCTKLGSTTATSPEYFSVLSPKDYNYDEMMVTLRNPNPHKQVFLASTIPGLEGVVGLVRSFTTHVNTVSLFQHMQFAMNGYNLSLAPGSGTLATLGVLVGDAAILGLNDAMWKKYDIGRHFNTAKTNVFYYAKSKLDPNASPNDPKGLYQDYSAQAVLKRSGSFMVCHNALTDKAQLLASKVGINEETALDEMSHSLMPGFLLVAAGVTAVQLAQEYAWKFYPG